MERNNKYIIRNMLDGWKNSLLRIIMVYLLLIIGSAFSFPKWILVLIMLIMTLEIVLKLRLLSIISKQCKKINNHFKDYSSGYSESLNNSDSLYYSKELESALIKMQRFLDSQNAIKLSNKRAEYRVLQNQINPHFLYNTLESIRSDAIYEGADKIAEITESLAVFFRYSISKVDYLVDLEDELSNAENYFAIQKYRFGEKIDMKIDCEEDLYHYQIPKLCIQPIIENSIIHGLEPKVEKGNISIKIIKTEDRLILSIKDDGIGIDEDVLNNINDKINHINSMDSDEKNLHRGGIALFNVSNRLKLMFGEKYGVRITSIKGLGTNVDITMPLTKADNR